MTGEVRGGGPPRTDAEELLHRIERRSLIFAALGIVVAWIVPGGSGRLAAGVAGGAILALASYWAIRRGVSGLADTVISRVVAPAADGPATPARSRMPRGMAAFVLRYALLAGIAYVMIARLRLAPLGLLCGASVVVLAVAAELVWPSRHRQR